MLTAPMTTIVLSDEVMCPAAVGDQRDRRGTRKQSRAFAPGSRDLVRLQPGMFARRGASGIAAGPEQGAGFRLRAPSGDPIVFVHVVDHETAEALEMLQQSDRPARAVIIPEKDDVRRERADFLHDRRNDLVVARAPPRVSFRKADHPAPAARVAGADHHRPLVPLAGLPGNAADPPSIEQAGCRLPPMGGAGAVLKADVVQHDNAEGALSMDLVAQRAAGGSNRLLPLRCAGRIGNENAGIRKFLPNSLQAPLIGPARRHGNEVPLPADRFDIQSVIDALRRDRARPAAQDRNDLRELRSGAEAKGALAARSRLPKSFHIRQRQRSADPAGLDDARAERVGGIANSLPDVTKRRPKSRDDKKQAADRITHHRMSRQEIPTRHDGGILGRMEPPDEAFDHDALNAGAWHAQFSWR